MALSRTQRILLIGAFILALILGFLIWDFSRRTTFPGKNKTNTTELNSHEAEKDRQ